jgi:hypothetical protein
MDLRTFRRDGPGLAECESQAAWRRLWADRRAHRSLDTRRTGLECGRILATIWIPGANPLNVLRGARGKSLWLQSLASRARGVGRGDAMTAASEVYRRVSK